MADSAVNLEDGDGIEEVHDAARLKFLLTRLRDERAWLSVRLKGLSTHFRSLLIDVDWRGNRLLLDELMPREVPASLARGHEMRILSELDGGRIMFDTLFDGMLDFADAPACACPLPTILTHWQRRREHRSVVGFGATIPVELVDSAEATADLTRIHGRLFDISGGGLSIMLEEHARLDDAIESNPANARIALPTGEHLEAPVDVLHVMRDESATPVRIGARFGPLSPEQQRRIIRFVMQCEREAARRHTAIERRQAARQS